MQIKSWHISLLGCIAQIFISAAIIIIAITILREIEPLPDHNLEGPAFGIIISELAILIFSTVLIIFSGSTLLLYFNKTRFIGAIFSIFFGIIYSLIFILAVFLALKQNDPLAYSGYFLILSPCFFPLAAGIYYFKKEKNIEL